MTLKCYGVITVLVCHDPVTRTGVGSINEWCNTWPKKNKFNDVIVAFVGALFRSY